MPIRKTLKTIIAIATILAAPGLSAAQELVPFVIPVDVNPKSAIAFSSPPIKTDSPRIMVAGNHFYLSGRQKKRVRIWGVNLCFGACFPKHKDAQRVAARLAAFGINSVRFHHMDSSSFPRGIWDPKDQMKLSGEALDRLDYFIDQLARKGIWSNVNLHVSRTHSRHLKLPREGPTPSYDKMIGIFTPALIDAQKKYARDLLGHVNKYRKVRYADDPAVAFVEITNENSLFLWGWEQKLRSLPPYYAKILQARYAAWLKKRYGTTAKLRAAWAEGAEPLGKNILPDVMALGPTADRPRAWRLEQHGGCEATAKALAGERGVRIDISKADQATWHVQLNLGNLAIKANRYYTVTFRARADRPKRISYNVGQAHQPWANLGLNGSADLTKQWRTFRGGFTARAGDDNARVNFMLGGSRVAVELADVQLRSGGREGLRDGESLEKTGPALFAESETSARVLDRMRFLAETEKAYFDDMYATIKKGLKCDALVAGTIVFGPLGLWAQSGMDYIDAHAYWHHPHFPGRPWDQGNWTVERKALVDSKDGGTLTRLAASRLATKPFTVSEYNHPAPNDYQAECVPMIASFGAAQDWDGIWLFAYSHRTDDWDRKHFTSFFDIDMNPAKWGFVPAGTVIFREAAIGPLPMAKVVPLAGGSDVLGELAAVHMQHGRDMVGAMGRKTKVSRQDMVRARVAVSLVGKPQLERTGPKQWGILRWSEESRRDGIVTAFSYYMALNPRASVWVGYLHQSRIGIDTSVAHSPGGEPPFVVTTVTPLDGKLLEDSRKILVVSCGRSENTDMRFSKDRRTVGRNWGKPPVRIETVRTTLSASWLLDKGLRCYLLSPDGLPIREEGLLRSSSGSQTLELHPEHKTMWYLLTREKK